MADGKGREERPEEAAEATPARKPLRAALRLVGTIALFVVLIAGVEVAVGGATAVAHQFGYSGDVAQMARLISFGLYGLIIFAFVGRRS